MRTQALPAQPSWLNPEFQLLDVQPVRRTVRVAEVDPAASPDCADVDRCWIEARPGDFELSLLDTVAGSTLHAYAMLHEDLVHISIAIVGTDIFAEGSDADYTANLDPRGSLLYFLHTTVDTLPAPPPRRAARNWWPLAAAGSFALSGILSAAASAK